MRLLNYLKEGYIYQNKKGEVADAQKRGSGWYVEVDNKFDMEFDSDKEFKRWIKDNGFKKVGYE